MKSEFYIKVDFDKLGDINLKDIPFTKKSISEKNIYAICGGLIKNNSMTIIFKINNIGELENFNLNYENKFSKYEITTYSPRLLPSF